MRKFIITLAAVTVLFVASCGESPRQEDEESLIIQGEETGGMGTGPGPGVDVTTDTAENISPDTVYID